MRMAFPGDGDLYLVVLDLRIGGDVFKDAEHVFDGDITVSNEIPEYRVLFIRFRLKRDRCVQHRRVRCRGRSRQAFRVHVEAWRGDIRRPGEVWVGRTVSGEPPGLPARRQGEVALVVVGDDDDRI